MKINKFICLGVVLIFGIFGITEIYANHKNLEIQKYLLSDIYQIGYCDCDKNLCNSENQFIWVDNNADIFAKNFYFAIRETNNPSIWFTIKNTKNKELKAFNRSQFNRVSIWYLDIINESSLPTECVPNSKIEVDAIFNSYGEEAPAVDENAVICQ
jgi:hypothetical protein